MPDAGSVWVDVLPDLKRFGPRLRAELQQHAGRGMDIPVGLDSTKAKQELDSFRRQLDQVGRRAPRITVSADTRTALASLVRAEKAADRLDGRVINMRVATSGSGPIAPVAPRTPSAPSGGGGGGSTPRSGGQQRPFSDVSPAGVLAITTLVPPLVPAVGALAGGLGAVASGFTAAGVGAAGFALAAIPAIREANSATDNLTAGQREFQESMGGLTASWQTFRAATDRPVLQAAASGLDVANVGLRLLTPATNRTASALSTLGDEAQEALGNPRWTAFFSFISRQANPSTITFGRSIGNLTSGVAGLVMNMEPLWTVVAPGLERSTARFAEWGHEAENFEGFIAWTIANGPVFTEMFGSIASAAIDVGVAIGPLGTIYAQGLTVFAEAISMVAETAPWLLQAAIAAKTAQVAFQLFGRVNTGLIQPMRELPGHIREYTSSLSTVGTNATTAATGTSRFSGALSGAVGALGGPWGIAIAAGVIALGAFATAKARARQETEAYTAAIQADAGALGESARALAVKNLEEEETLQLAERLGFSTDRVTDAVLRQGGAYEEVVGSIDEQIAAYDRMYDAGEISHQQWSGSVTQLMELRDAIDEEATAVDGAGESYRRQTEAMGPVREGQDELNASMAEGAFQARDLRTALDALTGAHVSAVEAESNFQAAVDAATASIATNGSTLDLNTEQGRANEATLRQIRDTTIANTEATRLNGESVAEQTATAARGREEFVRVARQMGLTSTEAEDLADEYLGIPSDVRTAIEVRANGTWAGVRASASNANPFRGASASTFAVGGPVSGPGTATSDSIPAWLSDGEFVQPTHVVDHYGVGFMEALRHKQIPKGAVQGFAKGGRVSRGAGSTAWDIVDDHRRDIRPEWNILVNSLIGSIGDSMAEDFKNSSRGPMGVAALAEASIGRYPESNGNNVNAITRWFGMNGAPWCAMFISWLFAQSGASRALGGAARTAWTGDYYTSGMPRTNSPQPGDVAVYGTRHVNLVTTAGGGRRVGGNQSNNVTAAPYSGGAIFRPNWGAAGFAHGGLVSIADIVRQDREQDERAGMSPLVRQIRNIAGYADGGVASGWAVVGERGPELARFDDPARVYSNAESARMLATAGKATGQASTSTPASPLVGSQSFHLHSADDGIREMADTMTHEIRVLSKGGRYADG
ncbi:hypothetical protein ABZ234_03775 [Nocardiopsis sp. NPDC006198]|uniref:hypothetical protein n=1 Tax=Nocardiopsis sp. NPDC006198 TaxID=3154472 RepID=UPI0033A607BB